MAVHNEELLPGFGPELDVDANVRKVVKALLTINDMTPDALAELIPMSRSTLYTRLAVRGKRSRFTVAEVYRMAHLFDVKVGVFYEPPELATIGYTLQVPGQTPILTVLPGGDQSRSRPAPSQFFPCPVPDLDE
jgi:hypothetical protein